MGFIIAGCVMGTSGIVTLPGGGVLESENGLYSSSPGGTFLVTCVTDGSLKGLLRSGSSNGLLSKSDISRSASPTRPRRRERDGLRPEGLGVPGPRGRCGVDSYVRNFSYIIDITFIDDNRYLESVVKAWPFRDTSLLNVLLQNICLFFFAPKKHCFDA